jgi:hypothetical protein
VKIKMLKPCKLKGVLQENGKTLEVSREQGALWIRAGWAEEEKRPARAIKHEEEGSET